jgi:hypothetical protein
MPAGDVPVWARGAPLAPAGGAIVTPCSFMHCSNAVRLAGVPALAEAAAGLDVLVLVELPPLVATTTTTSTTASAARPSIARRAGRDLNLLSFMSAGLSGCD